MQFHYLLGKSYEGDSLDEVGPLYEWEKESRVKVCFKPVKIFFRVASLERNSENKLIQKL